LSFVGVNGQEERDRVETVIQRCPADWQSEWLRARKLDEWAEWLDGMNGETRRLA